MGKGASANGSGHDTSTVSGILEDFAAWPALGIKLPLPATADACVAAFLLLGVSEAQADEALLRLRLVSDVPLAYQTQQASRQAKVDVEKFASVLDLMAVVNSEQRFLAAAMALYNGLATRLQCDRVSLGWLVNGYVRLKAISRTERFDKNMAAVKTLEMAMEESLDQNAEIVWPAPDGFRFVTRNHEAVVRDQESGHACSLPLRREDKPVAVLTCERQKAPFSETELEQFRLACDQATPRLAELQRHDRWFGSRWKTLAEETLSKALGPEHTWAKLFAVLGCAALVLISLPIFTYKVEGNFILRSDEVSFLTAPFDGYIQSVAVRPGDGVTAGAVLLKLNTDELVLQEAAAVSDQARYLREMEKARAANSLAEMRIFQAQADQAKARLELIRYRLDQSSLKAPFAGVVVEGDLRQRIGAPVKQGEALFKVVRTDTLYVEVDVNERDIHEILQKREAQIAFFAQPKLKFPVRVTQIEEAAFPKEQENVFLVRCALTGRPEPWWRPGMSGVCKLPVERRSLAWIFTHRTVDFLRMFFWW
jgi:multidrug resistance efflux pump